MSLKPLDRFRKYVLHEIPVFERGNDGDWTHCADKQFSFCSKCPVYRDCDDSLRGDDMEIIKEEYPEYFL